jgi:hypothetical protein
LLNFAGEDAIEVFNTFEFSAGDDKKLDKVIEQFERYCSMNWTRLSNSLKEKM